MRAAASERQIEPFERFHDLCSGEHLHGLILLRAPIGPRMVCSGERYASIITASPAALTLVVGSRQQIVDDMTLTPGTRIGPYEVTAQIGKGGIGGSVSSH